VSVENGTNDGGNAACERMAGELPLVDWRTAVVRMAEESTPEVDSRWATITLAMAVDVLAETMMAVPSLPWSDAAPHQRVARRWAGLSGDDALGRAHKLARKLLEVCTAADDGGAV
jgi:hypothetical protein